MENEREYTKISNLGYILKEIWNVDKPLIFTMIGNMPWAVALPLLVTFLSSSVVGLVEDGAEVGTLIQSIGILMAFMLGIKLIQNMLNAFIQCKAMKIFAHFLSKIAYKMMDSDYQNIENPEYQTKRVRAEDLLDSGDSSIVTQFLQIAVQLSSNTIGILVYTAIIFSLKPWLVGVLILLTWVNYYLNIKYNRWVHEKKEQWIPIDRKLDYINNRTSDFAHAKDVKHYRLDGWLNKLSSKYIKERIGWTKKEEFQGFFVDTAAMALNLMKELTSYGILIAILFSEGLSAAEFVFYLGIITQYSTYILGFMDTYNSIDKISLEIINLRMFLDYKDEFHREQGASLPSTIPEIEFCNVSFRYQGSAADTIQNVSFKVKSGEKLAIVGLNGAGKTTLIKLLCGLYMPTSGCIKVGGTKITDYNRDDYYQLIAAVFQDVHMLPLSIGENISLCSPMQKDQEKLKSVLILSGLYDKVMALPQKENTVLLKTVYEDAIEFSGGEKQKLALARCLYKGGKIIVLDEPTAALDPIAEHDIYMKYNELTLGTTSVFISHRLSSTKFCDNIILLENGEIVEQGNHETLLARKGKYENLFNIQSHHYTEEAMSGGA